MDGEQYYRENYPNYQRQNPAYKIDFYMGLLNRWMPTGGRLFELGVGLGLFMERASKKYTCFGADINNYAILVAPLRPRTSRPRTGSCRF